MELASRNYQRHRVASRQQIVERAEAYQRANMATPLPLSTLCRLVGLSERGLRNAFYSVRGMSPKRCLVAARLEGVRFALRDANRRHTTVTSIAAEYGFHELGRFAATYKAAYGEAPSETLRCTSRQLAVE
jgi:AraC family ethanolamine operon transcriptional activator